MQGFSEYFTFEALTKSDRYPHLVEQNRIEAKPFMLAGKRLSKMLESVRIFLGVPIIDSSGFRGKTLTTAGKWSTTSKHTKFEAYDGIPKGMSVEDAFDLIVKNRDKFPDLRKVIIESVVIKGVLKKWLHMEVKMNADEPQTFWATNDGKNYTKVG